MRKIDKDELVKILKDTAAGVESGDSLEGNLTWFLNHTGVGGDDDPDRPFLIEGAVRIGCLQGQGSYRVYQMWTSRVERSIEAAHHNGPEGSKCHTNHGHSWEIVVEFEYESLDMYGWGPDFHMIKTIIDRFDHKDLNVELAPDPASAEVLAHAIYVHLCSEVDKPTLVSVKEGGTRNTVVFRP